MKLKEMKTLPKKAGLATIRFNRCVRWPHRNNNQISLPKRPSIEFFKLQKGKQFLLHIPYGALRPYSETQTWFGGTDENVFLTKLINQVFRIFKTKGEKGFYQALKPEIIKKIEKVFGTESRRQGDIWVVPISPLSLQQFQFIKHCNFERPRITKKHSLFNTRHELTGFYDGPHFYYVSNTSPTEKFVFATGIVKTPNHKPMKLKEVHVLSQTRYLAIPSGAD